MYEDTSNVCVSVIQGEEGKFTFGANVLHLSGQWPESQRQQERRERNHSVLASLLREPLRRDLGVKDTVTVTAD